MLKKMSFFILMVSVVVLSLVGGVQAAGCGVSSVAGGKWSAVKWSGCSGNGGLPGSGDDVFLFFVTVDADSDISVSSIQIAPFSTLNAGSYTITLSAAEPLIVDDTFNAGTSTVKFSDADHTVDSSFTLYNWQWETPLTAPRTLTINAGNTVTKATGGTFNLDGTPTNSVSFAGTGTISPAITVYYCSSSTVSGINCQAGGPPGPEINVKRGITNIASGGTYNFGNLAVRWMRSTPFIIENTGSSDLILSGTPGKIAISGSSDFTVDEILTSPLVAGQGSTFFRIEFVPSSATAKTATLTIANNDSDEGTYTIILNGTGITSETTGYGSTPASGSTINVGTAAVGSSVSTTLTIREIGNATLNVRSHSLGGRNPGDFSVTPATMSIVDSGTAQNLTIQCTPSAAGARTATLTVNHNALSSPATYTLSCMGTSNTTPPPLPPVIPGPPLPIIVTAEVSNITDSEPLSGSEVVYPEGCTALLVGRGIVRDTVSPPTFRRTHIRLTAGNPANIPAP